MENIEAKIMQGLREADETGYFPDSLGISKQVVRDTSVPTTSVFDNNLSGVFKTKRNKYDWCYYNGELHLNATLRVTSLTGTDVELVRV